VIDNTPPVISNCPGDQVLSVNQPGCSKTATWTEPTAADNCNGSISWYYRSHAPGSSFSGGTTTVTYKFKDAAGNESICSFNITVNTTLNATVHDAFAYTPGTSINTIYRGWTPASQITYVATATGGQAPYTYKWTTSAGLSITGSSTQSSVKVTGTNPGNYTLTLTVKDAFGCQKIVTKTVTVVDVRCGKKNDMVLVCQHAAIPVPLCVAANSVASLLAGGATLGNCTSGARGEILVSQTLTTFDQFTVKALPNPSLHYFNIEVKSSSNERVTVKVFDLYGRLIEMRLLQGPSNIRIGELYKPGLYLVEVKQGEETQSLKILKLPD
jgi:PKD repeat protein